MGFAGTPASHSLTGSVPVRRAGMASGTADLQRDLGGAIMQSILGAVLTAGYAAAVSAAIAASPNKDKITDSVQTELTRSFSSATETAQRYPEYQSPDRGRRQVVVPAGGRLGLLAGIVAILLGAALVFFLFPKKEREEELLAQYRAEDQPQWRRNPDGRVPRPSRDQDASLIGHALAVAPRRASGEAWDRWIAVGFAVGSACFFIGPFPGFVQLVGEGADGVVFFAGSVFFTLAAALELREVHAAGWGGGLPTPPGGARPSSSSGTLLFNLSTYDAMQDGLSTEQQNRLVWAPDLVGSGCFLVSGALAYRVASGAAAAPGAQGPGVADGGGEPGRMRALRGVGDRVLRRARRAGRSSTSPPRTGPPRSARSASSSAPCCSFPPGNRKLRSPTSKEA